MFCLTVACGLLAGFALAQIIRCLPAVLFPELRAARKPGDPDAASDRAAEKGRSPGWQGDLPPCAARKRGNRQRPAWCAIRVRVAPTVAVMVLTTMILVWTMSRLGFTWQGAMHATWLSWLLVLAVIDLRHFLLPDVLTVGLMALTLLANIAGLGRVPLTNALCGALLGYAVLWSLNACYWRLRGVDGFGGGDLKMMAALGSWFGMSGVVDVLTTASVLAMVSAAIVWGVSGRRVSLQTPIPFGPFLAIAAAGLVVTRLEGGIGSFTALS